MEISINNNIVTIEGNIKSVSDYQTIKAEIDGVVSNHNSLILNITNSISVTSSVIGYFNKLVLKDKIDIKMNIGNSQLLELLKDLNLATIFKATKI